MIRIVNLLRFLFIANLGKGKDELHVGLDQTTWTYGTFSHSDHVIEMVPE